jgi:hypothetical protein
MFRNRIKSKLRGPVGDGRSARYGSGNFAAIADRKPAMVMVPCPVQQASWQAQLYQLAYQRAVAQVAPPRSVDHYSSVWN